MSRSLNGRLTVNSASKRGQGLALKVGVGGLAILTIAVVAATVHFFASPLVWGYLNTFVAGQSRPAVTPSSIVSGQINKTRFSPHPMSVHHSDDRVSVTLQGLSPEAPGKTAGDRRPFSQYEIAMPMHNDVVTTALLLTESTSDSTSRFETSLLLGERPLPAPTVVDNNIVISEIDFSHGPTSYDLLPAASAAPQPPALLIIPSLGVVEEIETVPVRDGQWDVSELGTSVGLLQTTGDKPGDDFAMTFVGHVTLPWPRIGPFANLIRLEHGQKVIYRWDGIDYIYRVESFMRVPPQRVDTLYEPDGDKILLVTCSRWDYLGREYAKRLITRAVLDRTEPTPSGLYK